MTQLELVKHDPRQNNANMNTIVAVSTSYNVLVRHCKEKYNKDVVDEWDGKDDAYYTINNTDIDIVRAVE